MKDNFLAIWLMSLKIVQYYFEINDEQKAYDVFDKAAKLVAKDLKSAYSIALEELTSEQMAVIWRIDGEKQNEQAK